MPTEPDAPSLATLREECGVVIAGPGAALVGTYAAHQRPFVPAPNVDHRPPRRRQDPDGKYRRWIARKTAATRLRRAGRHGLVFALAASGEASEAIGRAVGETADAVDFLLATLDDVIERSWNRWLAHYQPGVTMLAMRAVAAADARRARSAPVPPPARHTITVVLTTGDRPTATVSSRLCDEGTALGLEFAASTIRARMTYARRRRPT